MKVGDIVQPAARLLTQKGFHWLGKESLGLVVRKPLTFYGTWQIQWYGGKDNPHHMWSMRREWIKHARVEK